MKLLCLDKILFLLLFIISQLNAARTAFYYGNDFPIDQVYFYEKIVVQPEKIPQDLLLENSEKFFAYFSLEEKASLPENLTLGINKDWNTKIGDLRKKDYQKLLFEEIKKLNEKGFRNFFIDTIDSYHLVLDEEKEKKEYEQAIINFISNIKKTYPDSEIMLNRGFEIMEDVRPYSRLLAAESLYFGIDSKEKNYIQMASSQSNWLKEKLNKAKKLGYEVSVIDYLPKNNKEDRLALARKIKEDGFDPYITEYSLETWGQTEYEKIPREIIIFYDSKQVPDKVYSQAHRLVSGPIEYYGYIPKLKDIRDALPMDLSYVHGIIFVTENQNIPNPKKVSQWISKAIAGGKKILFLGYFPFPWKQDYFYPLSIKIEQNKAAPGEKKRIIKTNIFKEFEAPLAFYHREYLLRINKDCYPVSAFENNYGQSHVQAAICPWGAYAIDESWIRQIDGHQLFTFDPYDFFKEALKLQDIPALDPTTRNGRRALIAHIDGDGFISISNVSSDSFNGEVLKREILEKYKIPHSVSLIQGEIEKNTLKSQEREKIRKAAIDIFSMENIEIGNHSFSHPFSLINLSTKTHYNVKQINHLDIAGYKFNINQEIVGTEIWLEKEFSKTGKKNNLFFFTGDCIATTAVLKLLKENHMLNINGGNTTITKSAHYQYLISAFGIERDGYYQVYSGQQNENVYTSLWTGPFWGYSKVIETFELTDKPRRLKPINIYYHFYSAEKMESLRALKKVYDYALSLKTSPIYASKYSKSVEDFYNSSLYNYKNIWILANRGDLKTLRLTQGKYPKIKFSVAGYQKEGKDIYVNLYGKPPFTMEISQTQDKKPFIKNSSCEIDDFILNADKMNFTLTCFSKPKFETENTKKCSYKSEKYKKDGLLEEKIYGECK